MSMTKGASGFVIATHSTVPDHWDVQIGGGRDYIRVDNDGNLIQ